jgi:TolA-binding protein
VQAYFTYVKNVDGYGDIDAATRDSLMYTSGENLYMTAKYDRATETFRNYLKEFPNGIFRQNASFYLAESLRYAGKDDEALGLYTDVASQPNNQFTEQALIAASGIMYNKEDYQGAYTFYEKLENVAVKDENKITALRGQLRSAFEAGDAQRAISAAERIDKSGIAPDELRKEAFYTSGKANYSLNNYDAALRDFRKVATEVTSEQGAESKYMVAELLNRSGQTAEAEKTIQEFINQNTPHQYWMARMFLLLSDISVAKGDTLQAKATLQSLRDYYSVKDDGVLDEVKKRLDSIEGNK